MDPKALYVGILAGPQHERAERGIADHYPDGLPWQDLTYAEFMDLHERLYRSLTEYGPQSEERTVLWDSFFRGIPNDRNERLAVLVIMHSDWWSLSPELSSRILQNRIRVFLADELGHLTILD